MNSKTKPRIIISPGPEDWVREGADFFQRAAAESVARTGRVGVALSGGSTPRPVHRRLAAPPYRTGIPWRQTHIFWVDERLVPDDDPASNFGAARKDLIDHLPIPADHIHPMCSSLDPGPAAEAYQRTLAQSFQTTPPEWPVFDLILLGIGQDGHTASIFPGDATAVDTPRWVAAVKGGVPDVDRLTLTLPVLAAARSIVFLVSGSDKAETLRTIFAGDAGVLPPQRLAPVASRVVWILDREAANRLPGDLFGKRQ